LGAFDVSNVERKVAIEGKKIRVMHLNTYIGYDGPSRGIMGQAKYTDKDRFHTTICEINPSRHDELVRLVISMGCDHACLNMNKIYDVSVVVKLVRLLKSNKIDMLNTHNTIACWYGNVAARLAGIPVVFTLRNVQSENYKYLFKKSYFYKPAIIIDYLTMKIADKVVAVSERLKKYYIENMGIHGKKIIAISNAIDLEQFNTRHDRQQVKRELGIGNKPGVIIGIVGDLVERKGHAYLIEAAKIIVQENNNVRFLIVGDGPMKEDLIRRINKYDLSGYFFFTGHVKNVIPLLSIMDIFTLPSYAEGISRALMESMAMGIPSVCSAIDGNMEAIIDRETGLLFPAGDHKLLADKLLFLIFHEAIRKEMGEKARKRVEKEFNMKAMSAEYEKLYLNILNLRKGK
jgi:glycosyltransferase involved in cell wall biosynthesis